MSILATILVVASTSLHITVWPGGMGEQAVKKTYTLKCAPVGGTLPKRAAACTKLMRAQRPFAPVPEPGWVGFGICGLVCWLFVCRRRR